MDDKDIKELTPEQLALIPIIRDEWIRIYLDTTPIDKQKAEAAICLAYECAQLEPPKKILWFDNPLDALNYVASTYVVYTVRGRYGGFEFKDDLRFDLRDGIMDGLLDNVGDAVGDSIRDAVWYDLPEVWGGVSFVRHIIFFAIWNALTDAIGDIIIELETDEGRELVAVGGIIIDLETGEGREPVMGIEWLTYFAYFDTIGVDCSKANGLFATAKHCGWWWAFKDVAVAIPKPSAIHLDEQGRLHGEGMPAIAYQGFNVYAYHGVRLPEKYGSIHPEQWQSQWLLEEDNAELKRVLIQGIGYDRICQELQAIELDSWQEYTLLRIDSNIDIEPIYLLKMTCPSTGYIHALRVPPDVLTARDAIIWVNWGIAPEQFAVQT